MPTGMGWYLNMESRTVTLGLDKNIGFWRTVSGDRHTALGDGHTTVGNQLGHSNGEYG